MFGTQVQNVSWVGVFMALSMSAWLDRLGGGTGAPEPPSPPQADSVAASDSAPVAARKPRRLRGDGLEERLEDGLEKGPDMVNSRRRVLRTGTPGDGVLKLDSVVSGAVWRDGRGREGGPVRGRAGEGARETAAGAGPDRGPGAAVGTAEVLG